MNYLIDTNILTRLVQPTHPMHQEALDAVTLLIGQAHNLHVVAQNFYEFWVVATRPLNVNGLGKTAAEALADLVYFEGLFHSVAQGPQIGHRARSSRGRGTSPPKAKSGPAV